MKTRRPCPARPLRRVSRSDPGAIEALCQEVRAHLQGNGLAAVAFPVELAARECLVNAAVHGNGAAAGKRVALDLRIGRRWIRIEVSDEGRGFNWRRRRRTAASPTQTHGRGLGICAQLAGRIAFNQRGNRITLWLSKTKRRNDHG